MTLEKTHYEGTYKAYKEELKKTIKNTPKGQFSFFMRKFSGKFEPVLILGKNFTELNKEAADSKSSFSKDFSSRKDHGTFEDGVFSPKTNDLNLAVLKDMGIDDFARLRQDYALDEEIPGITGGVTFNDFLKTIESAQLKVKEIQHNEYKQRVTPIIETAKKAFESKEIPRIGSEYLNLNKVLRDGDNHKAVVDFLRINQTLLSQMAQKNEDAKSNYTSALEAFKSGLFTKALEHLNAIKNLLKEVRDYNYKDTGGETNDVKKLKEKIERRETLSVLYADAKKALLLKIQQRMNVGDSGEKKALKGLLSALTKLWDGGLQKALQKVEAAEGDSKLQHKHAESVIIILRRYIDTLEDGAINEDKGLYGEYLLVLRAIYSKMANKL